jgi:hypothetical protein
MTNIEQKIKFIRLKNGDDIITEVEKDSVMSLSIKNPMKLIIDVDVDMNRQQIIMYNWMPQGIVKENTVSFSKRDIVFVSDIEKDVEDHYRAVVFDLIANQAPFKSQTKRSTDESGKIISFNKNSKDKPN